MFNCYILNFRAKLANYNEKEEGKAMKFGFFNVFFLRKLRHIKYYAYLCAENQYNTFFSIT